MKPLYIGPQFFDFRNYTASSVTRSKINQLEYFFIPNIPSNINRSRAQKFGVSKLIDEKSTDVDTSTVEQDHRKSEVSLQTNKVCRIF